MELIKVRKCEISGSEVNAVDARELHQFLGVGKDFTNWIKDRISKYGFAEKTDFEVFASFGENPLGGRPVSTYVISMEMAKELAMVEKTPKGREARRYFIDCEKKLREQEPSLALDVGRLLNDPAQMLRLIAGYGEKVLALESTVAVQAPKVEALERISASEGSLCITDSAKSLGIQPSRLFKWLQMNSWIYRRHGGKSWIAYQDKIQRGLMEVKVDTVQDQAGEDRIVEQARVTPKGLSLLATEVREAALVS